MTKKIKKFGTPDLLAKFYLETGDIKHYRLLKQLISKYFSYAENQKNTTGITLDEDNIDPRIIPFLATISTNKSLPNQVKIISWNYDTQFERAARKMKEITSEKSYINNFSTWPHKFTEDFKINNDYFLLHLNGISGYLYSETLLAHEDVFPYEFREGLDPLLSFAWEEDTQIHGKESFLKTRFDLMKEMIKDTTVLVIIGYSFPFFNRKVDNILFSTINNSLKKIYYQDPILDGSSLYSQFGVREYDIDYGPTIARKVPIVHIKNIDHFHVPFEL